LQNKLGDTPLHACSWKGHDDCVGLLLDRSMFITFVYLEVCL